MEENKTLGSVFRVITPFLAIVFFATAFAGVFNTIDLGFDAALYNILLFLPVLGLALMLFRRFHVAVAVTAGLAFLLMYADQLVLSARLTHIRFSDLQLIAQAARVASRYHLIWNFGLTQRLFIAVAACGFLFFIFYYYQLRYSKKLVFFLGLAVFFLSGAVILSGVIPSESQEGFNFTADAERCGLLYSWYCQAQSGSLEPPEGYSKEEAEELLNAYTEIEGSDDVRVIVIMNESLADYSLLGETHFEDPLTNIHGLVESGEAFEGKLTVSVFGGGTANSEFEFLTGCSTAFLPEGCTPYLQYVNRPMSSIVEDFGDRSKIAIHPYYSEEWNRTQVYRFFGFDRFVSGVDFGSSLETNGGSATAKPDDNLVSFGDGPLYVRGLISDQTCFERIQEENADFTFAVTMQNHGSYEYEKDDFANKTYVTEDVRKEWTGRKSLNSAIYDVHSDEIDRELFLTNQYLTLSNLSDQAFGELLEELKRDNRKTMVLMFGDHQPGIMIPEHYVDCEESVDMDYTVPYILWANYDVEFDAPEVTSTNYLAAILKKNAGMGLTAWDQFRLSMMEEYPVVTANFILDKGGNVAEESCLTDYEFVQYMRIFD